MSITTLRQTAESSQAGLRAWLDERGAPHQPFYIVNAILVEGTRELVEQLSARPDVLRIEPNPEIVNPLPAASPEATEAPTAIEWGVDRTNAPVLWDLGVTGQGIVVAGQDTGIDWDHPALKSHYRGWNGSVADHDYNWHDSIRGVTGNPCGNDSVEPCDDHGHGTHTIGTVAGDDGGGNQIGMAPGARWIGCRNMDRGIGTPARYLECLEFFLAPYPVGGTPAEGDPAKAPDVTNNSWTCPPDEGCSWDTLKTAIEAQRAAGIMTVASAGNEGSACGTVQDPPALYDASYTVGSTTSSNGLSSFSSRGPAVNNLGDPTLMKPDIVAPGSSVRSSLPGGGYGTMSGTSMAGPHVAGAVALTWAARPDLKNNLNATENLLNVIATPLPAIVEGCGGNYVDGPNNSWGHGLLNLESVVDTTVALVPEGYEFEESVGNGNGVIERSERIRLMPTWTNTSAYTAQDVEGQITSPGGILIASATASYGNIPASGTRSCEFTGDCYAFLVNGTRPATHWDLMIDETMSTADHEQWRLHVGGGFTDVASGFWAYGHIETLLHNQVTAGCGGDLYCPAQPVTRWQIAVFLARSMLGGAEVPVSGTVPGRGDYDCTPGGVSVFDDVAPGDGGCRFVHFIAAEGISAGCGPTTFCPQSVANRWQMAVLLARAMGGGAPIPTTGTVPGRGVYDCRVGGTSVFADVAPEDSGCPYIHYIAAAGVTAGCGGADYCPGDDVARDQMAVFLVKAFGLQLYDPP